MKEKRTNGLWIVALLLILAAGYLASIGPAYRLHRERAISFSTFRTVYWPILAAMKHSNRLRDYVDWYTFQWEATPHP